MMNHNVTVNPTKRSVTVEHEGYKGTARCCPSDTFDLSTGIELALERAKVAKKNAEKAKEIKPTAMATRMSATMLAKQLEQVLPKGSIAVVVGGGDNCLTAEGKKWLATLAGVSAKCDCKCHEVNEDEIYDRGYDEGYADGYADAEADIGEEEEESKEEVIEALMDKVREMLDDILI